MAHVVNVVVGTYEGFFHGFNVIKSEEGGYAFHHVSASPVHVGSITTISLTNKYAATGGVDETIHLFNMSKNAEIGSVVHHEGTVTCLQIFGNTHLFSGSEDGQFCIWKTRTWNRLRTLKGHKSGITSLAVHPSGKLAITVSKDRTIRTWNLITGLKCYITNLSSPADLVLWSKSGDHYIIVIGNMVHVYLTQKANRVNSIDYGKKINTVVFMDDVHIAIGGEGGQIEIHRADIKSIQCSFTAHENSRVKGLSIVDVVGSKKRLFLVSSASDGTIRLWKLRKNKLDAEPKLLSEIQINQRITCSAAALAKPSAVESSSDAPILEVKLEDDDDSIAELKEGERSDQPKKKKRKMKEKTIDETEKPLELRDEDSSNIEFSELRESPEKPVSKKKLKGKVIETTPVCDKKQRKYGQVPETEEVSDRSRSRAKKKRNKET